MLLSVSVSRDLSSFRLEIHPVWVRSIVLVVWNLETCVRYSAHPQQRYMLHT